MISLLVVILIDLLFLFVSLYDMQMLQQNSYNERKKYFRFLKYDFLKNDNVYCFLIKLLFIICLIIYAKFDLYLTILYSIVLLFLVYLAYTNYKKHNNKLPLKFTKRMIRIYLFDCILFILLQILLSNISLTLFASILLAYILLHTYITIVIVYLLTPIEKMVFNHYKNMAMEKLGRMNNINIIGVTGSFGKTSTKMILDSILKTKYKGFYTPASFNTPNGILMTINGEKTIFNDYFISEMGAKNIGEIKELCDLVHPKYGILTSVGAAHLESFKTLDNVCKTKFELIESLPEDGVAILNKDDEYQRNYKLKNKCAVIWVGIDRAADVKAENIKISNKGTSFEIVFKKEKETIKVSTILLGNKNVYNILQAAALAKYLGVDNKNIILGIKNIPPINHRLEIKKVNNMTIIDDAFNSNPEGAKNALDVLNLMDGTKYIITPGMIEMGDKQEELQRNFGMQMASVCDKVYLVGPKQTKPIYDGLIKKKYNENNIKVFKSFKEAYNDVIKTSGNKKITVLIENDLPDSYMEE